MEMSNNRANRKERRKLKAGDRIADFTVSRLLGQGGYGDIYHVKSKLDPEKSYAMKLEMTTSMSRKSHLFNEKEVLKKLQDSIYFPRFVAFGQTTLFRYLVEECLGPSLSAVRRLLPDGHFSLSTSLRIGVESLRTIEAFHKRGFIHRDIKPSNFVLRPSLSAPILLIDYGLAKRYVDADGRVLAPRDRSGFAGTTKYASLNAHENKELGRRDDLFSWFFSLLEMATGRLPWVSSRDKQETYESKLKADVKGFCKELPRQLFSVYELIMMYRFEDEPDYSLIISFLVEAMKENDCDWDDKYEWQLISHADLESFSVLTLSPPTNDHPLIPEDLPPPIFPKKKSHSSSSISESYESESSDGFVPKYSRPTDADYHTTCPKQEPKIERNLNNAEGANHHHKPHKNCLIQ